MAAIDLNNVSVDYPVRHIRRPAVASLIKSGGVGGDVQQGGSTTVNALRDISFSLKDGDRLGLLGHNGAGKTTLLKTLAGVLPPTKGRVRVEGVVSALTSIQLGLDGDATGFENIKIRGRFMGIPEQEIDEILPEIAEFTELGEYLSLPIRTYSSGMRMRLSFAVSTAFQPDVILLDEWLSTGDLAFRNKAADRLREQIAASRIFVFATHSRDLHRRLSSIGAVLDGGRLAFIGDLDDAFAYQDEIMARRTEAPDPATADQ